jgi:hypothetical protein
LVQFESAFFPSVYLRMDGSGVTAPADNGGGVVNCQFAGTPGPWEKYKVHSQTDGSLSFESAAFPNVYLRVNGSGVTSTTGPGGGMVNCQFTTGAGAWEKFFLNMDDQRLGFAMQHQQQTNWCWAATSVSVAAFYDPATGWTQCSMVNAELGRNDCCGAGAGGPCNQPWYLDSALQRAGRLNQFVTGALSTVQVGAEMAGSTPVGVRTGWAGGGGHVLVVRGRFRSNEIEYVSVADPWYGDSDVSYSSFLNQYQGSGTWTHTYKTRS